MDGFLVFIWNGCRGELYWKNLMNGEKIWLRVIKSILRVVNVEVELRLCFLYLKLFRLK